MGETYLGGVTHNGRCIGVLLGETLCLQNLENSDTVAYDATFFITPLPFMQVFIIYFKKGKHFFPGVLALMIKKKESHYSLWTTSCNFS